VQCPWHGRKLQALKRIPRDSDYIGDLSFCYQDIHVLYQAGILALTRDL
jgi:hypothetical protein